MKSKSIEQLQYWQGQELRSGDFNDGLDYAEQLRWMHNRASHGAFGIGFGLTVDVDGTVGCGVAYDCLGRELVVAVNRALKPDAAEALQYLAVTWGPAGADLTWIPPDLAGRTRGVLLARAKGGKIDPTFRAVHALALSRPRLSSGATPPGNTPWEKIRNPSNLAIGLRVRIDTSAAGFTKTPLYLVSPVWTKGPNTRFTPPYVVIDDPQAESFTVRLLLQASGGQEKFEVATNIETVTANDWSTHNVAPFTSADEVARVIPRVTKAVEIVAPVIPANVLTLAAASSFNTGDSVALVNLPRNPAAERTTKAIQVADASRFDGRTVIRREAATAGFAAGDATGIDRVLSTSQLLFPTSPIRNLSETDHLDIVQTLGSVLSVSPDGLTVTLTAPATLALKKNDIAIRTSGDVKSEVPVLVDSQSADKTSVKLKTPIPSLASPDELGVTMPRLAGQPGAAVTGFVETVTTSEIEKFRKGDVLGGANGTIATVTSFEDDVLLLDSALAIAADGTIAIGDFGPRSTITAPPTAASFVKVNNPAQFANGDVVALVKGPKAEVVGVRTISTVAPGTLNLNQAVKDVSSGDVVAAVRFSASSPITALAPLTVADSSKFRIGDQVTLQTDTSVCWEIDAIQSGNVVKLKTGGPAVTGILCVVTVDTVAKVVAPGAGAPASSLTIDGPAVARKGWYAAQIDSWKDATEPATLDTALPDGTLSGDSLGFAALTPTQLRIRFASGVKIPSGTQLIVDGPDESTGIDGQIFARVQKPPDTGQATLTLTSNPPAFKLRPETLSVLALFPQTLADDFAAYAQQQELSVYWLGCELPSAPPPDCPGIPANGVCSC